MSPKPYWLKKVTSSARKKKASNCEITWLNSRGIRNRFFILANSAV